MEWHALPRLLLTCAALTALPQTGIAQSQMPIKVGVLTDMSGPYANFAGAGAVVAAELAIEDHMRSNPQVRVELLRADHQNKADIAVGIARR